MELYKNAFQIQSEFGGRNLFQYLLVGHRPVLLDSGIAGTPDATILPFMDRLRFDPACLSMLITTHPDMDHQGGNDAMRRAAPGALLACGEADRGLVSDPRLLYTERYNHLRADHGLGFDDQPPSDAGSYCRVDIGFQGGERIVLDDDWELDVLHVPGHSNGHLALYDRAHKSAFLSDAIHGHGCPKIDGSIAIPVTYYQVDLYLSTLSRLETLGIESLYTGHWPNMHGDEIRDFFADSRNTVARLDRCMLGALAGASHGLTLKQLIGEAKGEFPEWPTETLDLALFSVSGHLERLQSMGKIEFIPRGGSSRWKLV